MRLLRAELTRLTRRQASWWLIIATLALVGIYSYGAFSASSPPTASEQASYDRAYEAAVNDWSENGDLIISNCYQEENQAKARGQKDVDFGCDELGPPQRDEFMWHPPALKGLLDRMSRVPTPLFGLIALMLGATFVGAEFTTGSMATWLTFEPRRGRVFASKMAAAGIGGLVVGLVGLGLTALLTWATSAAFGNPTGFGDGEVVRIIGQLVRAVIVVTMLGLVGAAAAFVVRHSAAVAGLALAYLVGIEGILIYAISWLPRWTLSVNMYAFIVGRNSYSIRECLPAADGAMSCTSRQAWLVWPEATVYLFALLAALIAAGWLVYRRRDVN